MKIAIVYNRDSKRVINLFGTPNRERYGLKSIKRIREALRRGGHQARAFEGDKDIIQKLESFMPQVVKGERPGMVFNLSYGVQGQARYTHVPGILEMIGIPYVGSGPLAHSLALDKVVSKMIFRQHGIPTPDFAVLSGPEDPPPELPYPLIVKPKHEAVSFGVRIARDERELREGAEAIFRKYRQQVLVERFIDGREINVGVLGNAPGEALPPVELDFGPTGPRIYTYEDKTHRSGRDIKVVCPAPIGPELTQRARQLAAAAFRALGCCDCARVDMRLDEDGNLFVLEINSLPSLGEHGSFVEAARAAGLEFPRLVNRLVEVASARYFGTPTPPRIEPRGADPSDAAFAYLTQRRDRIERRLQEWTQVSSRGADALGARHAVKRLEESLTELGLRPVPSLSDERSVLVWETERGFAGGTLFIGHLDAPVAPDAPGAGFRREPEWLCGDGIASSRAPLVMLEYALRALKHARGLRELKLGVCYYFDEGRECRYSAERLRAAAMLARRVFVLRAANPGGCVVTRRRGERKYRLRLESRPRRIGAAGKRTDPLRWLAPRLERLRALGSSGKRLAVGVVALATRGYPSYLPHAVEGTIVMTYPDAATADRAEAELRRVLEADKRPGCLELLSDRPPMPERRANGPVLRALAAAAAKWDIPFDTETSASPSAGGFVPRGTAVVCGMGPVAVGLNTPQEAVSRISLVQRTLLLAELLASELREVRAKAKAPGGSRKQAVLKA